MCIGLIRSKALKAELYFYLEAATQKPCVHFQTVRLPRELQTRHSTTGGANSRTLPVFLSLGEPLLIQFVITIFKKQGIVSVSIMVSTLFLEEGDR